MIKELEGIKTAKPDQYFVLNNGRTLKNLFELNNALASMDETTFHHHVNKDKNDFSSWIEHVFHEKDLAKLVSKIKSRSVMIQVLSKNLIKPAKKESKVLALFKKRSKKNQEAVS